MIEIDKKKKKIDSNDVEISRRQQLLENWVYTLRIIYNIPGTRYRAPRASCAPGVKSNERGNGRKEERF